MSWLSNLWDGMSPCMTPGVDRCVVLWDAWAVIVAALAIGATLFLGYMTLRLGQEANKAAAAAAEASMAAVQIASEDREARMHDAEDRRTMLLVWIAGEVSGARTVLGKQLSDHSEETKSKFLRDAKYRRLITNLINSLNFPNATGMASSLHAIGHPVAAQFARARAMITMMQEAYALGDIPDSEAEVAWKILTEGVSLVIPDLSAVHNACVAAAVKAGIKEVKVD